MPCHLYLVNCLANYSSYLIPRFYPLQFAICATSPRTCAASALHLPPTSIATTTKRHRPDPTNPSSEKSRMFTALCFVGTRVMLAEKPSSKDIKSCLQSVEVPTDSSHLIGSKGGVLWPSPSSKIVNCKTPLEPATPIWAPEPPLSQWRLHRFHPHQHLVEDLLFAKVAEGSSSSARLPTAPWHGDQSRPPQTLCRPGPYTVGTALHETSSICRGLHDRLTHQLEPCIQSSASWGPLAVMENCLRAFDWLELGFLWSDRNGQSFDMCPNSSQLKHLVRESKSSSQEWTYLFFSPHTCFCHAHLVAQKLCGW